MERVIVCCLSVFCLTAAEPRDAKVSLPVKEVILYTSGVGFFERGGSVEGKAQTELRFRTEDINDLLKSMVVQDLSGGKVTAVSYESRDPITKTLKSFALDLTGNPSMRELLDQIRGERVTVSWPNKTTGTVLGVERREQALEDGRQKVEVFYLNLLAEGALASIPLQQVQRIEIENEQLRSELAEALKVLASGHDTQKKTVSFNFEGEGKRDVRVSYISQAPVWKTSYRLVMSDAGGYLQGWAIVENSTDENWENIQLSLVSGRPISFTMDLYQPLYVKRPVVQPELYSSLLPQVYGDSFHFDAPTLGVAAAPPSAAALGFQKERLGESQDNLSRAKQESLRTLSDMRGVNGVVTSGALAAEASVTSAAEGAVAGELFQYSIRTPVSIARQKSAMLPIVTEKVGATKLSIYNRNVQAKHPLNGLSLTNTTGLHLMQGPITVFDDGTYAGDARIEDLPAGQNRLVSYALDLKTEVDPEQKSEESLVSAKLRRGMLTVTRRLVDQTTYVTRNKDKKAKVLLIEHPVRGDWELQQPGKAFEQSRDMYRFRVELKPDTTEKLLVQEGRNVADEILVTSLDIESLGFYLRSKNVSERVKAALRKIGEYRDQLSDLRGQRTRREQRTQEISQEQTRIRENMARLAQNSELYRRYVTKFDEQETELESIRKEVNSLKDRETAIEREQNTFLSSLELD